MNPRQRRGTLLMILSALSAVTVFIMIVGYLGEVEAEVGARRTVLRLTQDVKAHEPLDGSLERTEVPARWWSGTFLSNVLQVSGKVAAADLPKGAYVQRGMLVDEPALEPGQREIAIMINAETGVAGKVRPGMRVDIYATFKDVSKQGERTCASRLIRNARVILVGQVVSERSRGKAPKPADVTAEIPMQAVPITFALTTQEALQVTRAESFATQVRLALIGEKTESLPAKLKPICTFPAEG